MIYDVDQCYWSCYHPKRKRKRKINLKMAINWNINNDLLNLLKMFSFSPRFQTMPKVTYSPTNYWWAIIFNYCTKNLRQTTITHQHHWIELNHINHFHSFASSSFIIRIHHFFSSPFFFFFLPFSLHFFTIKRQLFNLITVKKHFQIP